MQNNTGTERKAGQWHFVKTGFYLNSILCNANTQGKNVPREHLDTVHLNTESH